MLKPVLAVEDDEDSRTALVDTERQDRLPKSARPGADYRSDPVVPRRRPRIETAGLPCLLTRNESCIVFVRYWYSLSPHTPKSRLLGT